MLETYRGLNGCIGYSQSLDTVYFQSIVNNGRRICTRTHSVATGLVILRSCVPLYSAVPIIVAVPFEFATLLYELFHVRHTYTLHRRRAR